MLILILSLSLSMIIVEYDRLTSRMETDALQVHWLCYLYGSSGNNNIIIICTLFEFLNVTIRLYYIIIVIALLNYVKSVTRTDLTIGM